MAEVTENSTTNPPEPGKTRPGKRTLTVFQRRIPTDCEMTCDEKTVRDFFVGLGPGGLKGVIAVVFVHGGDAAFEDSGVKLRAALEYLIEETAQELYGPLTESYVLIPGAGGGLITPTK